MIASHVGDKKLDAENKPRRKAPTYTSHVGKTQSANTNHTENEIICENPKFG